MSTNIEKSKTKIYLDTSVPSAYYDSEKPERQELTKEFWLKIKNSIVHISELVKQELSQIENENLRRNISKLIKKFKVLKLTNKVKKLSEEYIKEGVVPERFKNDATHIAISTINNMDFLISWNFRHLVNVKTKRLVNAVNKKNGYKKIEIIAPPEFQEVKMFDVKKAIKESSISKKDLQKLEKEIRQEFPNDRMMYELHLIRALKVVK